MKFFKKAFLLSLVLIALLTTLASCSGKKKVTLSAQQNEISVIIGNTVDLKLSATEVKKYTEQDILSNLDIVSSDETIVKVEASGITAVGLGSANVTATWKEYDGATVTVKVNVLAPEVGSVTYTELPANVYVGDTFTINHQAGADVTVSYTSSDAEVLSVNGNSFNALKAGTAKITAVATNGYKEVKQEWNVEVQQGEYIITYVLNGGTNAKANPAKYDVRTLPLALAAATKANKKFLGWSLSEGSTDYVTEIAAGTKGDITLYANFQDIVLNITYVLNEGTLPTNAPKTFVQGEGVTLVNPTKEGYNFLGWSTTEGSTTYITSIATTVKADVKLYANFEKIKVYSNIVYVLNGGENPESANDEYEEGVGATLPTPTKDGYKFLGWTKEETGTNYVTSIDAASTGEVKVYAQWEKQEIKHTITYELNGGVNAADAKAEFIEGESYTLPTPTKEGFKFLGWTKEADSTTYVTEISATEKENVTVYAQWMEVIEGAIYVGAGFEYTELDAALAAATEGAKIILAPGEYALTSIINKSVQILGPNANLEVSEFGAQEAVINVAKDISGNLAAKSIVFNGVHLKGTGGGAGIPGVFFQDGGNVETLTFTSCTISDMNTFIKFVGGSSKAVLTIEKSYIHTIGQFAVWTTTGITKTILTDNKVEGQGSGAVANSAAALFRVRGGSLVAYNNLFIGDSANQPGYFESIAEVSYIKYNTFENVTKFAFTTVQNKLIFDENLYIDAKGKVLTATPNTLAGTGITVDEEVCVNEEDRASRYMAVLAEKYPDLYFLVTFDAAGGELLNVAPKAYYKEAGIESLPLVE